MGFTLRHKADDLEVWSPASSEMDNLISSDSIEWFCTTGKLTDEPQLMNRLDIMREMFRDQFDDITPIDRLSGNGTICGVISDTHDGFLTVKDESGWIRRKHDNMHGLTEGMVVWAKVVDDRFLFVDKPGTGIREGKKADFVAALISDMHVGSPFFQKNAFENFIKWLHTDEGGRVEYIIHGGDMIDNRGGNPIDEMRESAKLLDRIPDGIKVIMCPGNHDSVNGSLPQHPAGLPVDRDDVFCVINPSLLRIKDYDILLTHGQGLEGIIYYKITDSNANDANVTAAMQELLSSRHICPSIQYCTSSPVDNMIIESVPDMFVTGHVHRTCNTRRYGVRFINPGCWVQPPEDRDVGWSKPNNVMLLDGNSVKQLRFSNDQTGSYVCSNIDRLHE